MTPGIHDSQLREFERYLEHIEHQLDRSKSKLAPGMVAKMFQELVYGLRNSATRSRGVYSSGMDESLHMLMARAHRARSVVEMREILRDTRQFMFSMSSLSHARELENRLHDLETQVKSAAEEAVSDPLPEDGDVITLDGLKSKRVLFAIMPFAAEYGDVWSGGIKRAAAAAGFFPVRIDMITQTSEITDDIVKTIQLAEVVVVDVTRNNPNVMFEFGFALALKKPHVVISQSTEYLTFDIKNLRSVIYQNSWQGIESLNRDLQSFIKGSKQATRKRAAKKAAKKQPTPSKPDGTKR